MHSLCQYRMKHFLFLFASFSQLLLTTKVAVSVWNRSSFGCRIKFPFRKWIFMVCVCVHSGRRVQDWMEGLPLSTWMFWTIKSYVSELIAVADVCSRFKQIAQAHFRTKEYKHLKASMLKSCHDENGMVGISKSLRKFGASIVFVDVGRINQFETLIKKSHQSWTWMLIKDGEDIILVYQYCDGSLGELKGFFLKLTVVLAQMLQLLLLHD